MPPLTDVVKDSLAGAVAHAQAAPAITLPDSHPALAGNGLPSASSVTMCTYWPIAKPVILSLQHFLPSWTAWIVNVLVNVGDGACPGA